MHHRQWRKHRPIGYRFRGLTMDVTITRIRSGDDGTFGKLSSEGFSCFTGELPWRNNMRGISCVPAGVYHCQIRQSPKFGKVYHLTDTPGRSLVLIHSGNFCGDTSKGYTSHVEGCILLGRFFGRIANRHGEMQAAVCSSLPAVDAFKKAMGMQPFTLTIINAYDEVKP